LLKKIYIYKMRLLDINPNFLNDKLARKICRNKELKRQYIEKYNLSGGGYK
jgi:hypothetical protein